VISWTRVIVDATARQLQLLIFAPSGCLRVIEGIRAVLTFWVHCGLIFVSSWTREPMFSRNSCCIVIIDFILELISPSIGTQRLEWRVLQRPRVTTVSAYVLAIDNCLAECVSASAKTKGTRAFHMIGKCRCSIVRIE